MTIISADFILTADKDFQILEKKAILFDEKIQKIASLKELKKEYPCAKIVELEKNSILLPGLINVHTHLEFSANRSILKYGSFVPWLNSVIENRDEIMKLSIQKSMKKAIESMIKSGTTSFGAISSAGFDLDACVKSKARVVYFNEILGSNPASIDVAFEDFKSRLKTSQNYKNSRFFPSISVHSPYSTHPILAKKALEIALSEDMVVSTHFMESLAEREWIDKGSGDFTIFFAPFNPHAKPMTTAIQYIKLFEKNKTLFTHCVHVNDEELNILKDFNCTITHCPASNRLLGTGLMDYKKMKDFNFTIGTDGYSSNRSLNLWDELRVAMFSHTKESLRDFAKELLKSVTTNGDKALKLNSGSLEKNKNADFISVNLKQIPKDLNDLALHLILHTKKAKKVFIGGEEIV